MPKGVIQKRCKDCKRRTGGRVNKMEWCDCGGELIAIRWSSPKRRTATKGNRAR